MSWTARVLQESGQVDAIVQINPVNMDEFDKLARIDGKLYLQSVKIVKPNNEEGNYEQVIEQVEIDVIMLIQCLAEAERRLVHAVHQRMFPPEIMDSFYQTGQLLLGRNYIQ